MNVSDGVDLEGGNDASAAEGKTDRDSGMEYTIA